MESMLTSHRPEVQNTPFPRPEENRLDLYICVTTSEPVVYYQNERPPNPTFPRKEKKAMDKCPLELHSYICELTCVDDGSTIRSINKTSRYFYEISKPYLFQTLSISGPKQIRAIAALLETSPETHLRHTRHLFISDTTCTVGDCIGSEMPATLDIHTLILRIISLIAPTLQSLAFITHYPQTSTPIIARLFRISFPRLRNLAISGFYPFPTTADKFPQLERLHLNGNRNPYGLLQMSVLDHACPSLKFLKVSGLGLAVSFVVEVREAIKNSQNEGEESNSMFPAKFPAQLRRVTLQAGPGPKVVEGLSEGNLQLKDRLMVEISEDLNSKKTSNLNEVQVIVLDRSPQSTIAGEIKQEWLENVTKFVF